MGTLSKAIKYAAAGRALKHTKRTKRPTKKTIFIFLAVVGGIILILTVSFIALTIWLVDTVTSDPVTQTSNSITETAQSAIQGVNLDEYVQNGQVNVTALEDQLRLLSPEQLLIAAEPVRSRINQWVEQGLLIQSDAERLQQLLP